MLACGISGITLALAVACGGGAPSQGGTNETDLYGVRGAEPRVLVVLLEDERAGTWAISASIAAVRAPASVRTPTGVGGLVSGLPTAGAPTPVPRRPSEPGALIDGWATHYGESYNGRPLGCGTGDYRSDNTGIAAVSPARYAEWPCGTVFEICGDGGCIAATRHDACPGCAANHLDLSEAGAQAVCGYVGSCAIRFRVVSVPVP